DRTTPLPSRGGIGGRLKIARLTVTRQKKKSREGIGASAPGAKRVPCSASARARMALGTVGRGTIMMTIPVAGGRGVARGAAAETTRLARRGLRVLRRLTGVGLAAPKIIPEKM